VIQTHDPSVLVETKRERALLANGRSAALSNLPNRRSQTKSLHKKEVPINGTSFIFYSD
jgi:hypothetical protein